MMAWSAGRRFLAIGALGTFFLLVLPGVARATNGLNLIGSGGISSGLAGADTAVANDFTAMNTNPAGMTQIRGTHAGIAVEMLKAQLRLRSAANDKDGENDPLVIPNLGVVHHLTGTPFTIGIGFFTVGGTASDMRNLTVPPFGPFGILGGTVDKQGVQIRHYKLAPTVAYQVTNNLSLGASFGISYADVSLTVVPNTPGFPGLPFGFETTGKCNRANGVAIPPASCMHDVGFTPKFGAMYKINEKVTVGLAYTMPTSFAFNHGQVDKNYFGIGRVSFDAKTFGFKWPDDLAAGIALRPNERLLIAAKFQWINWDGALNNVIVQLTNSNNPLVPSDTFALNFKWRDQYVAAVGAAYDVTDRLNIRGGYNYGNNPVPTSTVDPTNANIVKHHLVGSVLYRVSSALTFDSWFTYAFRNKLAMDNSLFGPGSNLEVGGYEVGITVSYWH